MANTNFKCVEGQRTLLDTTDSKKAMASAKNKPSDPTVIFTTCNQVTLQELIKKLEEKDYLTDGKSTLQTAEEIYQQRFGGKENAL
ncbi:MAG: hypothetical protein FWC34_00655 [Bacteroidetes bacterium]|nr:hypothetical protein [Bacteroidota bacterium]